MAIGNLQVINIGLQNESLGSDSLYTAFNKTANNFANLFACASPYNTFANGAGISTSNNASNGTITITNTGVTNIIAGTNITVTSGNGNVTISSTGNAGSGVSNINVVGAASNVRITSSGGPIVSSGIITLDLGNSGVTSGTYIAPTIIVDQYGRITNAVSTTSVGTVTSVNITPGSGIAVTGGPITTTGSMTVTNIGVTSLTAGSGISLSGSNGAVTIATTALYTGTVTSVIVSSTSLTISGSPITTNGTITIDLPTNTVVTGNITSGNLITAGRLLLSGSEDLAPSAAANLLLTASYFTTVAAETATLAAGTTGLIKTFMMEGDGGDMVLTVTNAGWKSSGTGTITFNDIGDGCTLQYINSKWFCIGNNGVAFA